MNQRFDKYRGWLSQIQGIPNIDWENVSHVTEKTLEGDELNLARFVPPSLPSPV